MKNSLKQLLPFAVVGILSGATTFGAIEYFKTNENNSDFSYFHTANDNVKFAGINSANVGDDFVKAAKTTVPAVVTIKNYQSRSSSSNRMSEQDLFEQFFGNPFGNQRQNQKQQQPPKDVPSGLGSGVIISPDGYIISNNHVVAGANKLEVILSNKKSYVANLIGTDPSTDIALLKIEEKGLPYLNFANSDLVEVGQWVLAVGNPLGLNSTVTAGIVSAKGRSIDLLSQQSRTPIESFIQTDAAINSGNSGGALVNTNGELVGINSASYQLGNSDNSGIGFAIPYRLAHRIMQDLVTHGRVMRGYLGISTVEVDTVTARLLNLGELRGLVIENLDPDGPGFKAGLQRGDVLTQINGKPAAGVRAAMDMIAEAKPGTKITVTVLRKGKPINNTVTVEEDLRFKNYKQ